MSTEELENLGRAVAEIEKKLKEGEACQLTVQEVHVLRAWLSTWVAIKLIANFGGSFSKFIIVTATLIGSLIAIKNGIISWLIAAIK